MQIRFKGISLAFRLIFTLLIFTCFANANIIQKFANPNNCAGCHKDQVDDWKTAWHSHSHEQKNSLFAQVITYVQNKTHRPRAKIILECGKCHNPRLEVKTIKKDYMYAKAFGIKTEETEKTDKAINAKHVQNGISCYVCHNINIIKDKKTPDDAGANIIEWMKTDTIAGPFPPNKRAGFHKTAQRSHFIKGNTLCLVCHQGAGNENKFSIYNTGEEIKKSKSKERCVECHMSSKREGIIAPHIKLNGEEPVMRKIRSHLFAGARNSNILETALDFDVVQKDDKVKIKVMNLIPHKIPTGFAARSIEVKVEFKNKNKKIHEKIFPLRAKHIDEGGVETISYIAKELESDTRLEPLETREFEFNKPNNAKSVVLTAWYYLVAPSLQKELQIKDPIFTKKYPIKLKTYDLE